MNSYSSPLPLTLAAMFAVGVLLIGGSLPLIRQSILNQRSGTDEVLSRKKLVCDKPLRRKTILEWEIYDGMEHSEHYLLFNRVRHMT